MWLRKDDVLISAESVVVANTEVLNQALSSGGAESIASAFSNTQYNGNSKVLAQIIYNVMSSNPPGSFIVNQMLDILEQIKKNQGCEQILQILWGKDDVVVSEESIVVAINEQNTEVIKQALSSDSTEAVVSAFSSALQNGNLKALAQIFYIIMSTNPTESFIVNQMLDILQQIYFGAGVQTRCDQINQLLWEIDGFIESDEISQKLQVQFSGSFDIRYCLEVARYSSLPITADAIGEAVIPPQNKCRKSSNCPFVLKQTRFLLKDGVCAGMRVCDDTGFKERHQCEKRCKK